MDAPTEAPRPLSHRELRLLVIGALLPVLIGAIDNTILATALPTIGRDLDDVHNLPWLITVFLLASTAGIPLYGKIADIRGRRVTLCVALIIHLAGSLICALAPTMAVLIAGRVVQGIGSAGLTSLPVVVLGDVAAPKERGRYAAYFAVIYTTAGALGPALGGFLSEALHWKAIFWLGVPLDLMALFVVPILLRRLPRYERPHRLDLTGTVLLVTAAVSFMLALNLTGLGYAWTAAPVLALFAAAAVLGSLFVLRLLTAPEPLIPIAILRHPIVCWANVAYGCGWSAIVGLNVFLPIYLQSVNRLSPTDAGLSLITLMTSLNISAGIGGQLLGRVRHYLIAPRLGLALATIAVMLMALWADRLTPLWFQILLLLIGAGFGPTPSMCTVVVQNVVERHQLGIAFGTLNFSRNLFSTILVAILGALVLSVTSALDPGTASGGPPAGEAAEAFRRVFYVVAASLAIAFIATMMIELRPLRTDGPVRRG
ncbi:MAG: MFS transporter [Hyphomicrobiales bacterium]|nr:MFS transporter [Hyphomicrobiales bacterium]